jgi:alkyl hydroperoxide reductase subunit AhpC
LAYYASLYPSFGAAGAELVAVSVDPPERSAAVKRDLALPYSILSDGSREVIARCGVLNAREKGGIAVPSVFVLDRELRLRMLAVEEAARRLTPGEVLQFVAAMQNSKAADQPEMRRSGPAAFSCARWPAPFAMACAPAPSNSARQTIQKASHVYCRLRTARFDS